ncbi:MAG: hypothetical protein LBK99_19145 [Opitutaceae bacterium]|jgi:YD repeat-containing protein|nr:hypothetical protein [Opitutaceae bacterium]
MPILVNNSKFSIRHWLLLLLSIVLTISCASAPANAPLASEPVRILVDGKRKVGNFSLAFKDLALPLAGLPIEIVRGYDSRDRMKAGDFGYGWSLGVNAVTLIKNRPLHTDWSSESSAFNVWGMEMVYYTISSLNEDYRPVKHLVTLGFPDDTMATFEAALEVVGGTTYLPKFPTLESNQTYMVPIENVRLVFKPANARTRGKLEIEGTSIAWIPEAREYGDGPQTLRDDYFPGAPGFNPTRFRYTADDGTVYIIDEHLGLVSVTDPAGNQLLVERDEATGRIGQIRHSSGQAVMIHRDPQGRVESVEDPYGAFVEYVYSDAGDLTGVMDRTREITTYEYYTGSTDPRESHLAHFVKSIYDPRGTLAVRNEYDEQGRLVKQTDAHGNPVEFEHDLGNNREVVRDRLGYSTTHYYDAEGNVTRTINPDGGITGYEFADPQNPDSVTSQTDPLGRTTTYVYDSTGHITEETNPLGKKTATTYDANGNPLTITDVLGRVTKNTYNAQGLPATLTDAAGNSTTIGYNGQGNLTSIKDALGRVTSSTYDDMGRLETQTDAAGVTTKYKYDGYGHVAKQTRSAAGVPDEETEYTNDAEGRVLTTRLPDLTSTQTEYDAAGQPIYTKDAAGRETFTEYDAAGNVIRVTNVPVSIEGVPLPPPPVTEETVYDAENRATHTKDQADRWTRTYYDSMGRVIATYHLDGVTTRKEAIDTTLGFGTLQSATRYDLAGQVTKETVTAAGTGQTIAGEVQYTHDKVGNRLSRLVSGTGILPISAKLSEILARKAQMFAIYSIKITIYALF